jgi:4,5:9,10-diseco-3-hydroxy-5,9,17-trioxoandrosta-1(10),2-diene-4-oate hydrolase
MHTMGIDTVLQTSRLTRFPIRYVRAGDAEDVVLLIHGLGCSSLEWSENIAFLARTRTVIAVDLIGFGASEKPADFDYLARSQAQQLLALLDELRIQRVHVAGNSFGGKVAIEMTDLAAHRIKSVTLVASAGAGREAPLPMRISTLPWAWKFLPAPTFSQFRQGWQGAFHDPEKLSEDRVRQKFEDAQPPEAQRSHRLTLAGQINFWGFKTADLESLERMTRAIRCKTLIVWGRQDRFLPVAHAQIFQERIPHAAVKIFEDCGHAPQIERSEEFNRLLEDFLSAA